MMLREAQFIKRKKEKEWGGERDFFERVEYERDTACSVYYWEK
jgi:hypothetical protein